MSDLAAFWIGLGVAFGFSIIGVGIESFGCSVESAICRIINHLERNDPVIDE